MVTHGLTVVKLKVIGVESLTVAVLQETVLQGLEKLTSKVILVQTVQKLAVTYDIAQVVVVPLEPKGKRMLKVIHVLMAQKLADIHEANQVEVDQGLIAAVPVRAGQAQAVVECR